MLQIIDTLVLQHIAFCHLNNSIAIMTYIQLLLLQLAKCNGDRLLIQHNNNYVNLTNHFYLLVIITYTYIIFTVRVNMLRSYKFISNVTIIIIYIIIMHVSCLICAEM